MAEAFKSQDLHVRAISVREVQSLARTWLEPESASASLPTWLVKELHRACVGDETISGLTEEAARDLVSEIRSDELE